MAGSKTANPRQALRAAALKHPDTSEGVACEGTVLEKSTIKVGKKAFVFLGMTDVMVKLVDSVAEATKAGLKVGANGWVRVGLGVDQPVESAVLVRWIAESYRALASPKPTKAAAKKTKTKTKTKTK